MPSSSRRNITDSEDLIRALAWWLPLNDNDETGERWDVNDTNVLSNANSSSLAAGSSTSHNPNRVHPPHNFDLNMEPEEASNQGVEIASTPHPYNHGDPHIISSAISNSSTLPSNNGGLLRRRREPAGNAEALQRNTRMRTENGAASSLPSVGPNWFQNSHFEVGTSSSSQASQRDGPFDPRWTVPQMQFPGPSRVTNGSCPLPPHQVERARYELSALSTEIETWHFASGQPNSIFFNPTPLYYSQPFPSYSPSMESLFDHGASLNNGRVIGIVQHLINASLESHQPPPPFALVDSIIGNMPMPPIFNPVPRGLVVGPSPHLGQVAIADPGPSSGLLPQELHHTTYIIYGDNALETEDESEELEDELDLDIDNMSYEELVDLDDQMRYVGSGLTEETIMQNLSSTNYMSSTVDSSDEEEACCICQESYTEGEKLERLSCDHYYHFHCIKQWLLTKNNCPICKRTALDV